MSKELLRDEYCIVYNEKSGDRRNRTRAQNLSHKLGGVDSISVEEYPNSGFSNRPVQIFFSGDGTICSVANNFINLDKNPFLVIGGGGSGNHLYKILERKGFVIDVPGLTKPEDLQAKSSDYTPCAVEGKGNFFVNAGFGTIEIEWAKRLGDLRRSIPASIASYVSYLQALISLYPDNLSFNMILTDNPIGSLKLPIEDLATDQLVQIQIDGRPTAVFLKALLAAFLWRVGTEIPESIVRINTGKQFEILRDNNVQDFTLDGELLKSESKLIVKRAKERVKIVALKS